jgi:predicted nucleic-acid-binding protein
MKIIADTNVLLRSALNDDPVQSRLAQETLTQATSVFVGSTSLCEFAWVLNRTYKFSTSQVALAIQNLVDSPRVVVDRSAVDAGLDAMRSGADFADAVIAYEGRMAGGEVFVSFDKKAVTAMEKQGQRARLLA